MLQKAERLANRALPAGCRPTRTRYCAALETDRRITSAAGEAAFARTRRGRTILWMPIFRFGFDGVRGLINDVVAVKGRAGFEARSGIPCSQVRSAATWSSNSSRRTMRSDLFHAGSEIS